MKLKSVGYAYPTSTTAKKLGAYRTGCYFASISETDKPDLLLISGPFDTIEPAIAEAANIMSEFPWCPIFLRVAEPEVLSLVEFHTFANYDYISPLECE